MSKTIFFSWASDFDEKKSHNDFIINCLIIISKRQKINDLTISQRVENIDEPLKNFTLSDNDLFEIQSATYGEKGSPNIKDVIFDRISKCSMYICDVSIAHFETEIGKDTENGNPIIVKKAGGRLSPNPNVLIELGYAINVLGWNKIILLFDTSQYKIEDLPFDIRQHLAITFKGDEIEEELISMPTNTFYLQMFQGEIIDEELKSVPNQKKIDKLYSEYKKHPVLLNFINQLAKKIEYLDSPIEDYMQEQIDSILFCYLFSFSNMLYSLNSRLNDANSFLKISKDELESLIDKCDGGMFHIINTIDLFCDFNPHTFIPNFMPEIDRVYQNLTSSTLYDKKWIKCFIAFQKCIRRNNKVLIELFNRDGFKHYDIKLIKNDFISLILDFQENVIEWLKLTKRNNLEKLLPIFLPKGGESQLDFSDDKKRRKYCYLELNKCKYYYCDDVKYTLE